MKTRLVIIADVEKAAVSKGADYRAECFAKGTVSQDGKTMTMREDDFQAIREKYRPKLGDMVHAIAGPIGRAIHWPCLKGDGTTDLKPGSPCDQIKTALNKL